MREIILAYLKSLKLTPLSVSDELPWDSNGLELYLKNPKKIYVSSEDYEESTDYITFDGASINTETTTVRVYFATDAKNLIANFSACVESIRDARALSTGFHRRECDVAKTLQNDMMIVEIEFRYSKLI